MPSHRRRAHPHRRVRQNPDAETVTKIGRAILEATARAVYVDSFATRAEELGVRVPGGPGSDWMDIAPAFDEENPNQSAPAAFEWAEELWADIIKKNLGGSVRASLDDPEGRASFLEQIVDVWSEVATREAIDEAKHKSNCSVWAHQGCTCGAVLDFESIFNDEDDYNDFGHYIAMEALGHGVGWNDDHADHELDIPHQEADPWAIVLDADLGSIVEPRDLRDAIETADEYMPEGDMAYAAAIEGAEEGFDAYDVAHHDYMNREAEVLAISNLFNHLNYVASYVSENFERARDIAGVLLAIARREYEASLEPRR